MDNLLEVAEILEASGQAQTRLIVVGGSYLALHGLRESTRDVDTITVLDEAVRSAVQEAARRRGGAKPETKGRALRGDPSGQRPTRYFETAALPV